MSECRSCGDEIVWMVTPNGKKIPVDAETVSDREAEVFDRETMTTHFQTCPQSKQWRGKGDREVKIDLALTKITACKECHLCFEHLIWLQEAIKKEINGSLSDRPQQ